MDYTRGRKKPARTRTSKRSKHDDCSARTSTRPTIGTLTCTAMYPVGVYSILLIPIVLFLPLPSSVDGFCPNLPLPHQCLRWNHPSQSQRPESLLTMSVGDDDQTRDDTSARGSSSSSLDDILNRSSNNGVDSLNFNRSGNGGGGFNPLNYAKSGPGRRNTSSPSYDTTISIRRTRMLELTGELFGVVDGRNKREEAEMAREILDRYRNFLLEPLEDNEAVMDVDSIYTPQMSRSERYQAYRESIEERMQSSKSRQALAVLTYMRDYVLEFE